LHSHVHFFPTFFISISLSRSFFSLRSHFKGCLSSTTAVQSRCM
jgi:hypothetical protein